MGQNATKQNGGSSQCSNSGNAELEVSSNNNNNDSKDEDEELQEFEETYVLTTEEERELRRDEKQKRKQEMEKLRYEWLKTKVINSLEHTLYPYTKLAKFGSVYLHKLYENNEKLSQHLDRFMFEDSAYAEFYLHGMNQNVYLEMIPEATSLSSFSDFAIFATKEKVKVNIGNNKFEEEFKLRERFVIMGFPTLHHISAEFLSILSFFHTMTPPPYSSSVHLPSPDDHLNLKINNSNNENGDDIKDDRSSSSSSSSTLRNDDNNNDNNNDNGGNEKQNENQSTNNVHHAAKKHKKPISHFSDKMIKRLFEDLFPNIASFYRQLLHFDDIVISDNADGYFYDDDSDDDDEDDDELDEFSESSGSEEDEDENEDEGDDEANAIKEEYYKSLEYRHLKMEIPINNTLLQKNYPKLHSPFSGLLNLNIKLYHNAEGKRLLIGQLTLSQLSLFAHFIVSDGELVYMSDEFEPLYIHCDENEDDQLHKVEISLHSSWQLEIEVLPSIMIFSKTVPFPLIKLSMNHIPPSVDDSDNGDVNRLDNNNNENEENKLEERLNNGGNGNIGNENETKYKLGDMQENVNGRNTLIIRVVQIEKITGEWFLSFLIPIDKWKSKIVSTYELILRFTPLLNANSDLEICKIEGEVNTDIPTFSSSLVNLLKIFSHSSLLAEFLSLSANATTAIYSDFKDVMKIFSGHHLFRKLKQ